MLVHVWILNFCTSIHAKGMDLVNLAYDSFVSYLLCIRFAPCHFILLDEVVQYVVPHILQIKPRAYEAMPSLSRYFPSQLIANGISLSPRSVMGIPNPPFGTHRGCEHIRYIFGFRRIN
jgi:hypothetical protein